MVLRLNFIILFLYSINERKNVWIIDDYMVSQFAMKYLKSNQSVIHTTRSLGFYYCGGSIWVHDQRVCGKTKKACQQKILLDLVLTGHEWDGNFLKDCSKRFTVLLMLGIYIVSAFSQFHGTRKPCQRTCNGKWVFR